MRRNKRANKTKILLLILLAIAVGYAAISTTLKINGTTSLTKQNWNIYWDNPVVTSGSVTTDIPIIYPSKTTAVWNVTLEWPGDFYEFTIDAVNAGTIDARIVEIAPTSEPELPSIVTYTIKDSNGNPLALNHRLPKATKVNGVLTPTRETYTVRVQYDSNATPEQMSAIVSGEYKYTIKIKYGQEHYNASHYPDVPDSEECPGENCVYTFYYGTIYRDDEYEPDTIITEYERNYKNAGTIYYTTEGGSTEFDHREECEEYYGEPCTRKITNRAIFLGLILDSENKVKKAYACRRLNPNTSNEKFVCLSGGNPDSYQYNSNLIKQAYPDNYTEETDSENVTSTYVYEDGAYQAYANTEGHVSFSTYDGDQEHCEVYSGSANCNFQ